MRIFKASLIVTCMLGLLGCGSQQFSLPAVTETTDGDRIPGKIIWHDLLTGTPAKTQAFFGSLFGWTFEPAPGGINYTLIRHNGRLIGGMVDRTRLPQEVTYSQWVVAMSVVDIEQRVEAVRSSGGTVLTPPTSLGDRGRIAVVAGVDNALLALLETRDGDPADLSGSPATGDFLWHELWTDDVAGSARFYRDLAPLAEESLGSDTLGDNIEYQLLSARGRPRFGIRSLPSAEIPPAWVSYLRVADTAELDALLARVEGLGGRVLVPATPRPRGGSVAVIAGPSGAGVALQTWPEGGFDSVAEVTE